MVAIHSRGDLGELFWKLSVLAVQMRYGWA
jgi:hypothetical protein